MRQSPGNSGAARKKAGSGALTPHQCRALLSWFLLAALSPAVCLSSDAAEDPLANAASRADTNSLPIITTVGELTQLSAAEARRHYPVKLRAVVTYFDPYWKTLFVQDETAGVWVCRPFRETNFFAGQLLEIIGESEAVNAPAVRPATIKVLGTAPLPKPISVTYDELVSGAADRQWAQVQGVVRAMAYRFGWLKLDLASGNDHIPLYLPNFADRPFPTNLIGARVEARGVSSMKINEENTVVGFWFYVPSLDFVTVQQSAPADPFAEPVQSIKSLTLYNPAKWARRIKVRGVVTLWWPSGKFFIQDDTGPLEIRLLRPWVRDDPQGRYLDPLPAVPVAPGDLVEVVGYASPEFAPVLVDAEYRHVGTGTRVEPVRVPIDQIRTNVVNGELVTVEARLLEAEARHADTNVEHHLVLQADDSIFEAVLPQLPGAKFTVPRGSVIRATGVNAVQSDRWHQSRNFQLLLRDARDVTVLAAPPPFTLRDAARLGAIGSGVIVAGLVWIVVLRRRVAQRTAELAESNDRLQSEVEERRRAQTELARALESEKELSQLKSRFVSLVSHEFRTPLGVILASADLLSDYLHTLTPEERAEQIADIKQSTRHMAGLMEDVLVLGRVESGKMPFHPLPLDLSDFCRRLMDEILSATSHQCPIHFREQDVRRPARGDETLLRHIFHNLLSNAVKYSPRGQLVQFCVERAGEEAVFTVQDEGIGIPLEDQKHVFDAFYRGKNVGDRPGSGLGLVIVKRCAELHGGTVQIQSAEARGTTLTVRLPLFELSASARLNPSNRRHSESAEAPHS